MCPVKPDPKHPDRWRETYESHTSERPERPTVKTAILLVSLYYSVNSALEIASSNLK